MSTTKLIRWSGLISILAGVLYALGALLHPVGEDLGASGDNQARGIGVLAGFGFDDSACLDVERAPFQNIDEPVQNILIGS